MGKTLKYWQFIFHPVTLIFMLAFILRAAPNIILELREPGWHSTHINEIEFYYDDVARSLIAGKGFVHSVNPRNPDSIFNFTPGTPFHFVPPLYAWWLGVVYFFFGPNVLLAKILQCLLDSFVCVLLYKVAKLMLSEISSLLASLLYALYPFSIYTCLVLYYQIPMNLAMCWMILSFNSKVTPLNGMWTGVAMAVSALAKPVTLPFLFIFPAVKIFENIKDRPMYKPVIKWSVSFLITALFIFTPWTVRNYIVFHRFIPIQDGGGEVFLQGSKEEYIDLDVDSLRKKYGAELTVSRDQMNRLAINNHIQHLKINPLDYINFVGKKFLLTWFNTEGKTKNTKALMIQIPFLFFAIIGFFYDYKNWIRRPNWYVIALIIYICAIQVVFFPLLRYTLVVMPFVLILSASGMLITYNIIREYV